MVRQSQSRRRMRCGSFEPAHKAATEFPVESQALKIFAAIKLPEVNTSAFMTSHQAREFPAITSVGEITAAISIAIV